MAALADFSSAVSRIKGLQSTGSEKSPEELLLLGQMAEKISSATEEDKAAAVEAGVVPLFVEAVGRKDGSLGICGKAIWKALAALTADDPDGCSPIRDGAGIAVLISHISGEVTPDSEAALGALTILRNMAARSPVARDSVREAGGIAPLVALLSAGADKEVTSLAAATLRNLARNHDMNRTAIREAGAIAPLVWLLDAGKDKEVTAHACAALTNLAYHNSSTCDLMRTAGGAGALKPLVMLLGAGPGTELAKYAAGAVANVTWDHDENCVELVKLGAVPPLVACLKSPDAAAFAADALRNLARVPEARDAIRAAGGIAPLVSHVIAGPGASPLALTAVGAVRNLASNSKENREELRIAGAIPPLVLLASCGPEAEGAADAVAALRNLSRSNAENRDAIREADGIPPLVKLLGAGAHNEITAHAAAALANMSFENRENQEAIRRAGGIRPLMRLLGQNKARKYTMSYGPFQDVTTYAAGALANVANPAFALAGSCVWMCPPSQGRSREEK